MPVVQVWFGPDMEFWKEIRPRVNEAIKQESITVLSTPDLQLNDRSFTIVSTQVDMDDQLTADIVVVIQLDAREERVLTGQPDTNSETIGNRIASRLRQLNASRLVGRSVDVSLCHSQMGWATVTI